MKPTLTKRPNSYLMNSLLVKFAGGVPLSTHELHFLDWHEKTLRFNGIDEMLGYYLKPYRRKAGQEHSFVMPHEKMNPYTIDQLKRRLKLLLQKNKTHAELHFTLEQFKQFRSVTTGELILYHGNQFLTGAPFYYGGLPYIFFFQWGNLFGVAKLYVLPDDKDLKSNVLIYFEDMQERNLNECVKEYTQVHQAELTNEKELIASQQKQETPTPTPQPSYHSPRLTLDKNKEANEEA